MDKCVYAWMSGPGRMERPQAKGGVALTRPTRSTLCAALCALALLLAPGLALAEGSVDTAKEGGIGAAAALCSLVYGPAKIVYAVGGSAVAGFAWIFTGGDTELAATVLTRSVRGTYVITPQTILGEQEIEFVGRSPEYRATSGRTQVATAPDGW